MKKILLGVLAVAMTVGLVSKAAHATYNDESEVSGITITTGGANLQINGYDGKGWKDDLESDLDMGGIYPGWQDGDAFGLINTSSSPITLDVTAALGQHSGNWNVLKGEISFAIVEYASAADAKADLADGIVGGEVTPLGGTGWKTLEGWDLAGDVYIVSLSQGDQGHFVMWAKVDTNAGNEIAEKTLNLVFKLTGTQVL